MVEKCRLRLEFEFGQEEILISGTNFGLSSTPIRKSYLISIPYDLSMSFDPGEVLNKTLDELMESLNSKMLPNTYYRKYHPYKIEFKSDLKKK